MNKLNIILGQMDVIPANPLINFNRISELCQDALHKNVDVLILPELCLSGYLIGDLYEELPFIYDCETYGNKVANLTKDTNLTIIFGNIKPMADKKHTDGRIRKYNAVFVAQNGNFVPLININRFDNSNQPVFDFQPKVLLPNYREFEEPRHFAPLRTLLDEYNVNECDVLKPIDINGVKVGLTICEDGWDDDYPIKPIEILAYNGAELILNLSCSPFTLGKNNSRNRVFGNHAKASGIPVIYVNAIGLQNNAKTIFTFDGSSVVYNKCGEIVYQSKAFIEDNHVVEYYDDDIIGTTVVYGECDDEMIYNALIYAIRKYMRMSYLERVVIGSSGGIDSAVTAALYADAIGHENVYLVNMPSEYNSNTTKNLSKQLADNLDCPYIVIPISESVNHTVNQIDNTFFELPNGYTQFIKLSGLNIENIQARDRSARILAAVASAIGGVFTNNGNKTESTVGYCSIAGDLLGFLAVIGDLWKGQVYSLGSYINRKHNKEIIPSGIFNVVPSAELSNNQNVDDGKGDPIIYWYHDKLFRSFVETWNRATPESILTAYSNGTLESYLGIDKPVTSIFTDTKSFIDDLERWWKLFKGMGVVKREQAPPIVAVSRRAFGFDYRESLNCCYFSIGYNTLKANLLGN